MRRRRRFPASLVDSFYEEGEEIMAELVVVVAWLGVALVDGGSDGELRLGHGHGREKGERERERKSRGVSERSGQRSVEVGVLSSSLGRGEEGARPRRAAVRGRRGCRGVHGHVEQGKRSEGEGQRGVGAVLSLSPSGGRARGGGAWAAGCVEATRRRRHVQLLQEGDDGFTESPLDFRL